MANPLASNYWIKCISTEGNLRGVAIQATDLVQSLADQHKIKGMAVRGLGEAVMGALLIASYCKPGHRINLNVRGSGYFQQALVDAYPEGTVRGYVIERENIQDEDTNLGPWGTGLLSVLRTKDEIGEKPYIGTVPLLTGHLAKDLSFYWVQSEQIPSAVGLSVSMDGDRIVSAGGFLVQALPGASTQEVRNIEHHIGEIQSLAESLNKDVSPMHLLSQIFQSTPFIVVEEKPIECSCNCSWERVQKALTLVGVPELRSMLLEDRVAIVRCDFCAREYEVNEAMLEKLIEDTQN
jgi:molecular chaperone Hsp33